MSAIRDELESVAGKVALRAQRIQQERTMDARKDAETPPLKIYARNRELVARHYLEGRHANKHKKVAWVTSGAPSEMLKALDYYVLYPENHAALCGAARRVEEISSEAEHAGYSRDLCSYARTDIGAMLSGKTPVGRLPKPDLLMACTNICQTILYWYRVAAHHFSVPLVLIDTPFVYTETTPHAVEYVERQLEDALAVAERVAGKAVDETRLREVTRLSKSATELWLQVLARGKQRPAPLTAFDQFILMAPIVGMRGEAATVDFYSELLKELDERIARGIGAIKNERKRLLWDNLPIWYRLRPLSETLAARGAALVACTYTNAWAELAPLIDPEHPLESAARTYLHPILNRGTAYKLSVMKQMILEFQLDGAILHSDRSCKPYSIGQIDQRDRLMRECEIPALLLEADHADPRAFAEAQVGARLDAFLEMLGV